jgi:hypothetical protein
LKNIIKYINWFLENLYTEFIDWIKFLLIGSSGVLLAIFMWQSEGLRGKVIVIAVSVFIAASAIAKTYSKYSDEKLERQRDINLMEKILMENRIDSLDLHLGEIAGRFQKYLDEYKENVK